MSEDTKVQIDIRCPFCSSHITLRKKKNLKEKAFACPRCHKTINALFHVEEHPQTCEIISDEEAKEKKNKTIYKTANSKEESKPKPEAHGASDDEPNYHYDIYNDDKKVEQRPKRRFRGRVFLTHIRFFGLIKHKYPLYDEKTIIGRYDLELPSDIAIKGDSTMSRQSVAITIEDEYGEFVFKLKVMNATNVVKVNNVQIKEGHSTYLEFGDTIVMGNSTFVFDKQ
jgi:hypothetical protein